MRSIKPNQILIRHIVIEDCLKALMTIVINEEVDPQSLKQARTAIINAGWAQKLKDADNVRWGYDKHNVAEAEYERQESLRYRRYSDRAGDRG